MKKSHLLIGGAVAAVAAIAGVAYLAKNKGMGGGHPHMMPPRPMHHAMVGRGHTMTEPGISNVVEGFQASRYLPAGSGGHPKIDAAGWSYLTARNENYTFSRTPTNKILHSAPMGHLNATRKLSGANGMTYTPWAAIWHYF